MKISVVIPAYNEENYLAACLQSLKDQTVTPDEIIVVDNNSSDRTPDIAKEFGVTLIKEKKQGIIFARNTGYDKASGDIIVRTDADTKAPTTWIARIKDQFSKYKIDCITGPVVIYDLPFPNPLWSYAALAPFRILANGKILVVGPNHALTKQMWLKIHDQVCFDQKIVHEDFDIGLTIDKNNGKIKYDPQLVMFMSGRRIKKNPLSFFIEYPFRAIKTFDYHHTLPISLPR